MPEAESHPRRDPLHATVMLVLTTFCWGLSFPLMKGWQEQSTDCPGGPLLASATMILVRVVLAVLILAAFRPSLVRKPSRRAHLSGAVVGMVFFLGFILQVLGLTWTKPALSAFITSLGSAWVPLFAWLWWRTKVASLALIGIGLGIFGTALLPRSDGGEESTLGAGALLTFLSAMFFAVEILLLDHLGKGIPSGHLTVSFFAVTAVLALLLAAGWAACGPGLSSWSGWLFGMLRTPGIAVDVGLLTVFCTVLAFHWMNTYQPRVSASRAALIYLLEPVFAAAFSIVLGYDRLTPRLLIGGGIIIGGNLLVETPRLIYEWRKRADKAPTAP